MMCFIRAHKFIILRLLLACLYFFQKGKEKSLDEETIRKPK